MLSPVSMLLLFLALGRHARLEASLFKGDMNSVCNRHGYHLILAKFKNEQHLLCLKMMTVAKLSVFKDHDTILLEPSQNTTGHAPSLHWRDVKMAYGYPMDDPEGGSVEGYLGDDQLFYGVLHLGNRTIYAGPDDIEENDNNTIYFDLEQNVNLLRARRHDSKPQEHKIPPRRRSSAQVAEAKGSPGAARAHICELLLIADLSFYQKDCKHSVDVAVKRMVHAIAQADVIFRNADFDEDEIPDNIGFSIKYILVMTTEETNKLVFGNFKSELINAKQYLLKFARLKRLGEVCLGVVFSGHAFTNKTLGLSLTAVDPTGAALCGKRKYGNSFNTLVIGHAIQGSAKRVPESTAILALAHELGHSFGAQHDSGRNPECRGYLMDSQTTLAVSHRKFEFSVCSKRQITNKLASVNCLVEETQPFCGNGIVEEGEICDCGLPASCRERDPCCTPRAGGAQIYEKGTFHVDGCMVKPSVDCHPAQGMCCTPTCNYANFLDSGIDCKTVNMKCNVNCTNYEECRCALGGRCLPDGSCHAAECVGLGLRECDCADTATIMASKDDTCGICCELKTADGKLECVRAEKAAQMAADKNRLPVHWPAEKYRGLSSSYTHVCSGGVCRDVAVRAWGAGGVCVSRGVVGRCEAGVCSPPAPRTPPRTNVYPAVSRRMAQVNLEPRITVMADLMNYLIVFLFLCLIRI